MGRFIFLTFGFLAVAFYELSGGSSFDPAEAREALVTARSETTISQTELPMMAAAAAQPEQPVNDTVSRAALNLVSFDVASSEESPAPVEAVAEVPVVDASVETPAAKGIITPRVELLGVVSLDESATPDVTFAGLTTSASSEEVFQNRDIRTVNGSVVNMRAGPGTSFEVVDQLTRNTRVEVISDAGNGWVELRPVDGGATGWMADFLLADG